MGKLVEYIKYRWNRRFAINPVDRYPAIDEAQKNYRIEFGDIVDKYLIYYESERDEGHPDGYHRIIYIDAENDIDWQVDGENLDDATRKLRQRAISQLDIAHALPVHNLSEEEIIAYKKLLGTGYNLALSGNFDDVDKVIDEAKQYRDDRNKEKSRWLLLTSASVYLILIAISYWLFIHHHAEHPHFELISGTIMGAVGAYVSIWSRYGNIDMTGLGEKMLHYLESFSRMLIGAIFAFVILLALKSGIVFSELVDCEHILPLSIVLGFCAGFSEKFVPSVLESFMHKYE